MNRWFGTSDDSSRQSSERDRRAARRTINSQLSLRLSPSGSEDEFNECETSFHHNNVSLNLDGQTDYESDSGSTTSNMDAAQAAAAELARQKALPFEDSDYDNDVDSWKKEIKLKFDPQDAVYWFNSVESQLKKTASTDSGTKRTPLFHSYLLK